MYFQFRGDKRPSVRHEQQQLLVGACIVMIPDTSLYVLITCRLCHHQEFIDSEYFTSELL